MNTPRRMAEPLNIVRMTSDEAMIVIKFRKLIDRKLDVKRFAQDPAYRYSAFDALLASVENLNEKEE